MGMKKISLLYIIIVILVLCCLMRVSSLRMLQESKATPISITTTQTINVEGTEFVHGGNMGVELNDYPGSGANNCHSPHSDGTR
ncbi:hypothetical protein BRADI_4g07145v3 [Brachypodium distachyon]|uniref:Transmembrane protein n=1 Tax=Brachypodium distachyon TaxID=15368 RepID=I1IIB8_BRADI|nr:hypothetical protein BRADI_4g07145v3 [Brachypodium distachyon]